MISENRQKRFELLFQKGLLGIEELETLKKIANKKVFSLHFELRTLLYLSVMLFTGGVGILVYNNIDSIGHSIIISALIILTLVSFYYIISKRIGFDFSEVKNPNPIYDYIVLLANVLLGIVFAYLQFMYNIFGDSYYLPTLIPTVIYFISAYFFDHKGVLSIAITGLAATIGLSLKPNQILNNNFYNNQEIIFSSVVLSVLFIVYTIYSNKIQLKTHFNFTYLQFALHLFFSACLFAGGGDYYLFYLILVIAAFYYFVKQGFSQKYFSLIVFSYFYAYIFSIVFFIKFFSEVDIESEIVIMFFPLFYMLGTVYVIRNLNKIRKSFAAI
jgi:hypothetical protein